MAKLRAKAEVSVRLENGKYVKAQEGDLVELDGLGNYYVCKVENGFWGTKLIVSEDPKDRYNNSPKAYIRVGANCLMRVVERG